MWARPIGMSRVAPDARGQADDDPHRAFDTGAAIACGRACLVVGQLKAGGKLHGSEDTRGSAAVGTVHDTVRFGRRGRGLVVEPLDPDRVPVRHRCPSMLAVG